MFRFEDSTLFYLLALIPLMAGVWYLSAKNWKIRAQAYSNQNLLNRLWQNKSDEKKYMYWLFVALIFLVIAFVNPQLGEKKEKIKTEKSDIMLALDISNSMNATDISPSRLEKAKRFLSRLIESRKGDQLGLILFAGGAYLQMPLTSDYAAAELFCKAASTNMAGTQGTAIGEAIDLAMRSVKDNNQRALVVISDGEDQDDDAISMAEKANSAGWTIFTIGVGTEAGGMVPVIEEGRETYKTDEEGNPVRSVINQQLLNELADAGDGKFYMLAEDEQKIVDDINIQLEKLTKRTVEIKSYSEFSSYYQYFLLPSIAIILFLFFYKLKAKY
ncbi:MAG: VWA domain-containing protein [Saprospiraceae bacterium]